MLLWAGPVWGADTLYCFSVDGSDANDCLCSGPNWCKTIEKANNLIAAFSPSGTDDTYILFKENDQWDYAGAGSSPEFENGSLSNEDAYIDINPGTSPTATSNLIIGAAHASGNYVATMSSSRPVIDFGGNQVDGSADKAGVQSNITSVGHDYYTVENLEVANSGSKGVVVRCRSGTCDGITVRWNKIYTHNGSGIFLGYGTNASYITENIVYDTVRKNSGSCTGIDGAAIEADWGNDDLVISGNKVYGNYGEGVGAYYNYNIGNPIIFQRNQIYNSRSANIHSTDSHTIIRHNLVGIFDENGNEIQAHFYGGTYDADDIALGTSGDDGDGVGCNGSTHYSSNIGCNTKTNNGRGDASKFEIYSNLVFGAQKLNAAGTTPGGISCSNGPDADDEGDSIICLIYNNTMVDNDINLRMNYHELEGSLDSYVKNNISVFYDEGSGDHGNVTNTNIQLDYNLWSSAPDADMKGANDILPYANPKLATQSGWLHPASLTTFTGAEFAVLTGTPACPVAGVADLENTSDSCVANITFACGFDNKTPANTDFTASPVVVDLQDRDANPAAWCAGAFEWLDPPDTVPNVGKIEGGATLQ
jgi:hypothetical protein